MPKRYLITGVTSFLGSNLAKKLLADGYTVYGVVRPQSKNLRVAESIGGLELVKADFDDFEYENELYDHLAKLGVFDIYSWIHFSWDGIGSVGRSNPDIQQINLKNAQKAFKTAEKMNVKRFVFSGSQAEYGTGSKESPEPVSPYGQYKYKFYEWASNQDSGMEYVHMRIYSTYGPGDHPTSLVNTCIRTFLEDKEMVMGACTHIWNYMDIRDCTRAISLLSTREEKTEGVFEIASSTCKPLKDYVMDIHRICGFKGECLFGQRADNAEGAVDLIADLTRLKGIGFEEDYTFEEGIRNIINSCY